MLTLGSLFDGVGGWQLAGIRNGIKPIWSAEIEPFPIAVTKEHFPETIQLGDVTKIDGSKIPAVDIICMGSPCQDLSIANGSGRKGLEGEKSGLFFEAIRIVRQMRMSSGGVYPKVCILENVQGMLTSNEGMDFRTVLASYTDTEIPMPISRRWANAGLVRSRRCDVAWRSINSECYLPQRRERIFLICDFTKDRCASKILFVEKCLRRDIETKQEKESTSPTRTDGNIVETSRCYESYTFGGWRRCVKASPLRSSGGNYGGGSETIVEDNGYIRRLTPLESERLMGLPDDWTKINSKLCSQTARFRAIGNGMAQPIADWIMKRISEEIES